MKFFTYALLLLSFGAYSQTLKVNLKDYHSKLPVGNATVSVPKYNLNAVTDSSGTVSFSAIPLGRFEVEVSSVEYGKKLFKELVIEQGKHLVLDFELQTVSTSLQEVVVSGANPQNPALIGVESITREQILRFPATFMDPARLVMALPGVAGTNDQANNISVRGNAPEFVQWRLEGVEIVNPNHLSNAGMFSDKPASAGGGTNILSAQMLGNMNFLSGAFPAGYSNAVAGVLDMSLRNGNKDEYQNVLQVGLLGIDVSSEGPISKKTGSSYLFNYRYSFTGLLGQAGVDFGGEKINFQDLAFTLNFPTKKAGTFTVFGMGGNSKNYFAPDADSTKWESSKDLNNVEFLSRMGLIGAKHNINIFKKWNVHTVLVNSALENLRNAYTQNYNINYDYDAKNVLSFTTSISGYFQDLFALKLGINLTQNYSKFNVINSDSLTYSYDNLLIQPYFNLANKNRARFNYNLGFVVPYYTFSSSQYFEPRISANYYLKTNQQVKFAYGLHSQIPTNRIAYILPHRPTRSHKVSLGYQYDLNQNQSFYGEVFFQGLFNTTKFNNMYMSPLNGYEVGDFVRGYFDFSNSLTGRNYGVELNYKHHLANGFFALANATFYKSQFKAFDNKFYNTRFAGDYVYNLTVGKEWELKNNKIFGANTRINWIGGFRDYGIGFEEVTANNYLVYYDFWNPLVVKYDDYFRADVRLYLKTNKKKGSNMVSLDIQNLSNRKNVAHQYYDVLYGKIMNRNQLGLIPMLNYRWEF